MKGDRYTTLVLAAATMLSSCASPGNPDYTVFEKQAGLAQLTIRAETRFRAGEELLSMWGKEISLEFGDGRREVMVNFYFAGRSPDRFYASWYDGSVAVFPESRE